MELSLGGGAPSLCVIERPHRGQQVSGPGDCYCHSPFWEGGIQSCQGGAGHECPPLAYGAPHDPTSKNHWTTRGNLICPVFWCVLIHTCQCRGRPVGGHGLTGFIYVPRDPVGTFANKLRVNVLGIGSKDGLVTRVSEPLKVEPNRPRKG